MLVSAHQTTSEIRYQSIRQDLKITKDIFIYCKEIVLRMSCIGNILGLFDFYVMVNVDDDVKYNKMWWMAIITISESFRTEAYQR